MKIVARLRRWWRERPCYIEEWTRGGPILIDCETYWRVHEAEMRERDRLCREGKRARCV